MYKTKSEKAGAGFLIFLCWLAYSVSYLGKVNYSANIAQVIDFYNVSKAEAGLPPTFFFFAYGIGQVINGTLCKKYNVRFMIPLSLLTSSIINLVLAGSSNFSIIKWLWMANGFSLSILWPSLVRLLSQDLPQRLLSKSSIIMGTTPATGTLVIYTLSSVFAFWGNFKLAFFVAAFADAVVAVIWLIIFKKVDDTSKRVKNEENGEEVNSGTAVQIQQTRSERKLVQITFVLLCLCAIVTNLIKDGLTTWVPVILKEEYSIMDSISILLTLFLPAVAIFGNMFSMKIHELISDYITHCAVVFTVILGSIGVIIGSNNLKIMFLMLMGLLVVSFLASSLNSVVTSIFPMLNKNKKNSGLYAGVLNGFCYLGSAISSFGLGAVADRIGWVGVFWCLLFFCALICVVLFSYILYQKCQSKAHR